MFYFILFVLVIGSSVQMAPGRAKPRISKQLSPILLLLLLLLLLLQYHYLYLIMGVF
jgi:hypothetical protein